MKDITKFGTDEYPLRPSGLHQLLECPWKAILMFLGEEEDTSGEAADTGSAVHAAIAAWHQTKDKDEALKNMRLRLKEFPLANFDEAENNFDWYTRDPRNINAKIYGCEIKVKIEIDPAEEDETKEKIIIKGTLDQIRIANGVYRVYDIKTSKRDPLDLIQAHTMQMAAYCMGASSLLGVPVHPGALICTRRYEPAKTRRSSRFGVLPEHEPDGVFAYMPWEYEHIPVIMSGLALIVALIRKGNVWINPGEACKYCPAGGVVNCIPKLYQLTK